MWRVGWNNPHLLVGLTLTLTLSLIGRGDGGWNMPKVFDVLLEVGRNLEAVIEGAATGDGSTTTLKDTHVGAAKLGTADDEFNDGVFFWKTSNNALGVTAEEVGAVDNSSTFDGTTNFPPLAGTLSVTTPLGTTVDDSDGNIVTTTGSVGAEVIGTVTDVADEIISPDDFEGTLGHPYAVPGTIQFTTTDSILLVDNALGEIYEPDTGLFIGSINYETGVWAIVNSFGNAASVSYSYYTLDTTLDHFPVEPGSVAMESAVAVGFKWTDDSNGNLLRGGEIEGAIDYDTGAWSVTTDVKPLTVDYFYYKIRGTIDYETGALHLIFPTSDPQSGPIYASYSYAASVSFIPVIANVSDFTAATGTITFEPSGSGLSTNTDDEYGVMANRYPRWLLFQKLNETLREIRDYRATVDILVADFSSNSEYALAGSVTGLTTGARILKVWQGTPTDADGNVTWVELPYWSFEHGILRINDGLSSRWGGDTVRVEYQVDAPQVRTASQSISELYSLAWLSIATAVKCVRWRLFQPGADERLITLQLNDLIAREQRERAKGGHWSRNPVVQNFSYIPDR